MDFTAFDSERIERYAKEAKAQWGETKEYREFEQKKLTKEQQQTAGAGLMERFKDFAALKDGAPDAPEALAAEMTLARKASSARVASSAPNFFKISAHSVRVQPMLCSCLPSTTASRNSPFPVTPTALRGALP